MMEGEEDEDKEGVASAFQKRPTCLSRKYPHLPCRLVVPPAPVLAVVRGLPQDLEPVAFAQ